MPASTTDPVQFGLLTQSIAYDMQTLAFHWRLYSDLYNAIEAYEAELNQSRTFWYLTFESHRDASLFRLCRLYDQHASALSLKNWLVALRDNPRLFRKAESTPVPSALEKDIAFVCDDDPDVNTIVRLRNNTIAHRAVTPILSPRVAATHCSVSPAVVDKLVDRAKDIVNRHTRLLNRETYSTTIVGQDDYQTVLRAVRTSLETACREAGA